MSAAYEWAVRRIAARQALAAIEDERPAPKHGLPYLTGLGRVGFLCSDDGWPVLIIHPTDGERVRHEYKWADDIEALKRNCRWVLDAFGEPGTKEMPE